jgi:hypothetical protein
VSLLWREQLNILLSPRRLAATRASGGPHSSFVGQDNIPVEPAGAGDSPWRPAIVVLSAYVAAMDAKQRQANIRLVLSDHYSRYALVPWSDALGSAAEEVMLAKHCFKSVYGPGADDWAVRITLGNAGQPRLASAVEPALLAEIDQVMQPLGRRFQSLQPHFVMCFNHWRSHLPKEGAWLITIDDGMLCVARVRRGEWVSVNTMSVGSQWRADLPSILEREEALSESGEDSAAVIVLAGDGLATPWPASEKWRFQELSPTPFHEAVPRSADALAAAGV